MMWSELMTDTFRNVRAHSTRFGLTSLGVFWGVLMLTFLSATSTGYDQHFGAMVSKIGPRIVYLFSGAITNDTSGQRATRNVVFEREDIERISKIGSIDHAAANLWLSFKLVRAGKRSKLIAMSGADENTVKIRNYEIAVGRSISRGDVLDSREVVFLGFVAAQRIFGDTPAVGRRITIESIPFRVIGVSKEKGDQIVNLGVQDDELAFIPVTTAQRRFTHDDSVGTIIFEPRTREISWSAIDVARAVLGLHQGFDHDDTSAVGSFNIHEVMTLLEGILSGLKIFLAGASLITLFVGGAGVMNIMLVVVTERTREIGLRKAIGASNSAIFTQFLCESLCVTMISGTMGAAIGTGLIFVMANWVRNSTLGAVPPVFVPASLIVIFFVIVIVGVVSGLLPAVRASRIEPAISLRG
ncbi:MAG: ABC transporter permease [Myxococcales bacterium]|nr:ABC transporter permease [Myxococcales bacterium]